MYVTYDIDTEEVLTFNNEGAVVAYYNKHWKGEYCIDVFEGVRDATGMVLVGDYVMTFVTENYGDLQ